MWQNDRWKMYGLPKEIVSDRDTKFTCEFWKSHCKQLNVKSCNSTAFHSHPDGADKVSKPNTRSVLPNLCQLRPQSLVRPCLSRRIRIKQCQGSHHENKPTVCKSLLPPRDDIDGRARCQQPCVQTPCPWDGISYHICVQEFDEKASQHVYLVRERTTGRTCVESRRSRHH